MLHMSMLYVCVCACIYIYIHIGACVLFFIHLEIATPRNFSLAVTHRSIVGIHNREIPEPFNLSSDQHMDGTF